MAYIPYHSGVPDETELPAELSQARDVAALQEFLAPEPRRQKESARAANMARAAHDFFAEAVTVTPAVGPTFWIHFWTDVWRPNHKVTIRAVQTGWFRDLFGLHRFGGWHFELPRAAFPNGITMKFLLNGVHLMTGANQTLDQNNNHHFANNEVDFATSESRFRLPYENFVSGQDQYEQVVVFGNTNENIVYDVIVIGSGMGGGVLADAISDKGVNTLVLDAGGLTYSSHITNLPGEWESLPARHQVLNFENKDGSEFLFGVQMVLGGRSVFWSGLIPRMRDWEMTRWPTSVRNFLTTGGYDRAEALLRKRKTLGPFQDQLVASLAGHFSDYEVFDTPMSRHQPDLGSGNQLVDVLEKSTGVFSTADLLLDSLTYEGPAGRDRLTVNTNHLVTRIETSGGHAVAVICQDLVGNTERRYLAHDIVLAAGSLESPRIALQSGLSDPHGKIGRGLSDHPAYFSAEYSIPTHLPDGSPHPLGDPKKHAKIMMRHQHSNSTQHAFNVEVLLNPWHWDARHPDDDMRKQRVDSHTQSAIKFTFVFETALNDANSVMLQGPDQKLAVRVARNPTGEAFHNECKQLRNDILAHLQIPNSDPGKNMGYGNQGTPHHAGGSMRMSDNNSGVVDENLKFHGYDNLYACDVSVFPSIPCANPSLTLSALAIRLGDHLAAKHGH